MNIAIIGGGFTGLTAAYELAKRGHKITLFEKDKFLGGLAHGFKQPRWDWHLESAYHHLFTNDTAIINLIKELGLSDKLIIKRPITANYVSSSVIPFDSPLHLLGYPNLSLVDKLRTAVLVASIKLNPFWQPFEWITAKQLFLTIGGRRAWETIWEPLMIGKFGQYADRVAASWLWARIKKRTPNLCYIVGGFHTLVTALEQAIITRGGTILTDVPLQLVSIKKNCFYVGGRSAKNNSFSRVPFDRLLLTVPTPVAAKLIPHFSLSTVHFSLPQIPHLHAQILILETKQPIIKDIYWLNVTDRTFPFLAVITHTNMIDKKHYGGRHITYFGNYLPNDHPYLSMTKKQLLKVFLPYIKRLNPHFHWSDLPRRQAGWSDWSDLFIGYYAQPVHELHYSQKAPKFTTPIPGLFLANMDSIYPWDRGTNYAVELGQRAAKILLQQASDEYPT